jgi:hypothetical protein
VTRSRTAALALITAAVGLVGAAPTGGKTTTPPAEYALSSTIGVLRTCSRDIAVTRRFAGYRYVILNAWNYGLIRRLKAQTPGVKVLVYKDMATSRADAKKNGVDNRFLPAGVGFMYASTHHPEWFLSDASGAHIAWNGWPWQWQMDVGNPAYQQAWLANVTSELKRYGWDGVLIDNANASLQYPWILNGRTIPRYPTDLDYQAATTGFLEQVGPALKKQGFLVIANMNDAPEALWERWIGLTSGAMKEWWTKDGVIPGEGFLGGSDWRHQMDLFRVAQSKHRIFLAVTETREPDSRAMRYARASFLLGWDGGPSASVYQICNSDPWSADSTTHIGFPTTAAYQAGGVWRRGFTQGTVLVNPSSLAVSVKLARPYLDPNGSLVTSAVLDPMTGLVLQRPARSPRSGG